MPKFTIRETIEHEIEAEDAQAALDSFLENGSGERFYITDRAVFNEDHEEEEVDDQ